jgi:hypothetical protein
MRSGCRSSRPGAASPAPAWDQASRCRGRGWGPRWKPWAPVPGGRVGECASARGGEAGLEPAGRGGGRPACSLSRLVGGREGRCVIGAEFGGDRVQLTQASGQFVSVRLVITARLSAESLQFFF